MSTPVLWRCPSCPLILVGPQIKRAGQHVEEHGTFREIERHVYAEHEGVHSIGVALVRAGYEAGVKARG